MTSKITKAEDQQLQDIIDKSGNKLHLDVTNLLRDKGWDVTISPYYVDEHSEKPREIDVLASKVTTVETKSPAFSVSKREFKITLCIECKYLTDNKSIFWVDEQAQINDSALIRRGVERSISIRDTNTRFTEYSNLHHYNVLNSEDKIGILYDNSNKKDDRIFKSFTQSIKSLIFFRNQSQLQPNTIFYPIVVYNPSNIYLYNLQSNEHKPMNHCGLFLNYSYIERIGSNSAISEEFIVDFVLFDVLDKFLDKIDNEITSLSELFRYELRQDAIRGTNKPELDLDNMTSDPDPYD